MSFVSSHPDRRPRHATWLLPLALVGLIVGLMPGAAVSGAPPPQLGDQHAQRRIDLSGWQVIYRRAGWGGGPAVDLRAAGDLMLGRYVGDAFADRPAELFGDVAGLLGGDVSLANLESPLTGRAAERPGPYRLVASPGFAPALRDAGLDILGLANNHALDAGPPGLADAVAVLREVGLQPAGVGASEAGALNPVTLERNGLRVAVLAFNDVLDPADGLAGPAPLRERPYQTPAEDEGRTTNVGSELVLGPSPLIQPTPEFHNAGLVAPGDQGWINPDFAGCDPAAPCAYGRAWLAPAALDAVAQAHLLSDLVVVLVHWGLEYQDQPSLRQRAWAERLVAAGADLVLGAHPHVPQPAQLVAAGGRSGFVAYSLGNFVFDGPDDPARNGGMILRALLDEGGVALVAVAPVTIDGGRPSPAPMQKAKGKRCDPVASPPPRLPCPPIRATSEAGSFFQPTSPFTASRCGAPPLSRARERGTGGDGEQACPDDELITAADRAGRTGAGGEGEQACPDGPNLFAWRWDGAAGEPIAVPTDLALPPHADRVGADLRGNGEPNWAALGADGVLTLRDGPAPDAPVLWRNEAPGWRITRVAAGDPNDDGRAELLLLLWQPDPDGALRSHPFLLGWRGGRYQIIWGGSATATPIQDLAVADLEGDGRSELVVLEGGRRPGDPGAHVSVWRWHGWGFQLEWRSAPGSWSSVYVADVNSDERLDIVAE